MKVKIFEVVLHKLPSGKSPATALEEQLNSFLVERPQLRLVATHMSTLVSPAEPNAMPDDADNPVETSRPFFEGDEPSLTIYERDELHRPLRIIEPDGSQITTYYAGKRIDVIDQRGEKTSFYRDAEGNTTAIHQWVDGVEQVTSYQYDVLGQLVGITDALGEQTKITYDMLGRRTRLDDPNTGTYLYRYDDEDRLVEQTGPDGLTTRFEYNHAGDLLRKLFPDGSGQEFTPTGRSAARNTSRDPCR